MKIDHILTSSAGLSPYCLSGVLLLSSTPLLATNKSGVEPMSREERQPNIIVFLVDDMGWQDTSYPFATDTTALNRRYHTPHMERLARQGIAFTSAYASSVSSPSRVSLLTGMNAARHRVTNWTLHRDRSTDIESNTLRFPAWNVNGITQDNSIPHTAEVTSLASILQDHGYHTIHCGKAHWGAIDTPGEDPHHLGFDVNIAGHAAGGLASYYGERRYGHDAEGHAISPMSTPGLESYWDKPIFITEALTREAIKALEHAKGLDQPFFLHMAHYAVHIPIEPDPRYVDQYLAKGISTKEAAYASLIEGMDKSLGDIMDWLESNGLSDNTIILFLSDNGGLSSSSYWREEPLGEQNAPLSSGKGSAYEGGIRIPMLAYKPRSNAQGVRCDIPIIIEDLFPTILDLAGIRNTKTKQTIDGMSFISLLEPSRIHTRAIRKWNKRPLVWNYPNLWGNTGPGIGPTCTILQEGYKLIYYYETGRKELFHIPTDLGEKLNLIDREPKRTQRLSRTLGRYLRSASAQRPTFKSTNQPCPWPDEV